MKIVITVRELMERWLMGEAFEMVGINQYAVNEGQMGPDDEVTLTPEQAVALGLIEEGERW